MAIIAAHIRASNATEVQTKYLSVAQPTGRPSEWVTDPEQAHRFASVEETTPIINNIVTEPDLRIRGDECVEDEVRAGVLTSGVLNLNSANPRARALLCVLDVNLQTVVTEKITGHIGCGM